MQYHHRSSPVACNFHATAKESCIPADRSRNDRKADFNPRVPPRVLFFQLAGRRIDSQSARLGLSHHYFAADNFSMKSAIGIAIASERKRKGKKRKKGKKKIGTSHLYIHLKNVIEMELRSADSEVSTKKKEKRERERERERIIKK